MAGRIEAGNPLARARHQEMPPFRWEDIDHRLVILKLTDLAEKMRSEIKADEGRIRFENRGNRNRNTVPSLLLKMKQNRADEWAGRVYEIYCDVWQTQGYVKSAAFVRAVYARGVVPVLRARTQAIASEFAGVATRTSFPVGLHNAHLQSLRLNMLRVEGRWRRRLEIEAKECEHAERRKNLDAISTSLIHETTSTVPSALEEEVCSDPPELSKGVREGKTVNLLYGQIKRIRRLYRETGKSQSQIREMTSHELTVMWEWTDRISDPSRRSEFLKVSEWDDGDGFVFRQIATLYQYAPHLSKKPSWSSVRDWRKAFRGYKKHGTSDGRKPHS
jgi:hypothetical protein